MRIMGEGGACRKVAFRDVLSLLANSFFNYIANQQFTTGVMSAPKPNPTMPPETIPSQIKSNEPM